MSESKMTPAEVLAVMDMCAEHIPEGCEVYREQLEQARTAVEALVAEREAFKREAAVQLEEMEGMHELIVRQGDLLTGVVNAIRGEPAELCRHSHHDAPELAAGVVAERDALLTVRETLKRECEALKAERDALREALKKLLEAADDSDGACYGTLGTGFVRGIASDALAGAGHE